MDSNRGVIGVMAFRFGRPCRRQLGSLVVGYRRRRARVSIAIRAARHLGKKAQRTKNMMAAKQSEML